MKTLLRPFFLFACMALFSVASLSAQEQNDQEKKDYLIVVSNSRDKSANEKVLEELKGKFDEAGMYYDEDTRQYYVYIERYYAKSGADYAVWWHGKEHKDILPKIWAKPVPPGAK